jgi:hypothetical protein
MAGFWGVESDGVVYGSCGGSKRPCGLAGGSDGLAVQSAVKVSLRTMSGSKRTM